MVMNVSISLPRSCDGAVSHDVCVIVLVVKEDLLVAGCVALLVLSLVMGLC